jgi:nucleotide-binding universal stress UspA family protein
VAAALRVLFPLDGSEPAYNAMEKALRMLPPSSTIRATVLVVMQDFKGAPEDMVKIFEADTDDEVFPTKDSANQVFVEMKRRVGKMGPKVKFKVATGNVKDEILTEAAEHDILVMHSTSRGGSRARGSHKLARKASCAVLLVRP